jgi:surfeit locus 1 family protein
MRKGAGPILLCSALGIALLCGLGVWQVKRLAWKTALIAQLEARVTAKPITLSDALLRLKAGEDVEYLRVEVDAADESHMVLRKQTVANSEAAWEGIAGYHGIDGAEVLVDLGASESGPSPIAGPTHFEALLRRHGFGRGIFDPANAVAENRWHWWDLPAMQKTLGLNNSPPVVLQLVGEHAPSPYQPSEPKIELNNNHLGYAITWFGLAAALAAVAGAFVFGRERR